MTFLQIKFLSADGLDRVVALDQLCFGKLWTFDGYRQELDNPQSDLLVAYLSTEPEITQESSPLDPLPLVALGCAYAILEECHITILGVHPSYRQQGLGQVMLYSLLMVARDRQLERATLEVAVSNHSARSLYQKFGFREAGRRQNYYQQTGEDALVLWRNGLHRAEFREELVAWHQKITDRVDRSGWIWSGLGSKLSDKNN